MIAGSAGSEDITGGGVEGVRAWFTLWFWLFGAMGGVLVDCCEPVLRLANSCARRSPPLFGVAVCVLD